jgi:two-component system, cell cycle sensor histidine kinase and response regulator CckA
MVDPTAPSSDTERFYATIVHSLGGIVWEADPTTFHFTFVSEQAERILGYPVREWLDDPEFWRRHTHSDDVDWCTAFCVDSTRSGRDHTFEYRMIAKDGGIVWLRDVVTVKTEPDGSKRMLGVMFDISDLKRAEEARLESEALYRFLTEHSNDVITLYTLDRLRVFASPSFTRVLGSVPENVLGGVHPDDRDATLKAWERTTAGEQAFVTFRHAHTDGGWRWLEASSQLVQYRGTPHVLAVTRDVTERKRLEDQLRQAQKMEAVGQLAGGIAHDFNNLLTVIRGYAELLAEHDQQKADESDIEEIRRACDRAVMLTQQLLAFSRKQVLHPHVLDLNAVVSDIVTMLGRIIGETITLAIDTSARVPPILADRGQVQQVIVNLAVNARDAMPFGGILTIKSTTTEIAASSSQELTPGRYAELSIVDTGSGISPEILPRIFEPFFTTKEPGKGTGLGLSTVYGIMKQSGGHLAVESVVGGGTTFTLYFPEATQPAAVEHAVARPMATSGTETLLLVEDEAPVRELLVRALQGKGYDVHMASHGAEAVELCGRVRPQIDLLITDVVMPGMSGPELVRRLESIYSGLRVLYMSGYAGEAIQRHGINEFGITEFGISFMQKPFTVVEFLTKVRDVLEARDERPS